MSDAGTDKIADMSKAISSCEICIKQPLKLPLPHEPRPVVHLYNTAKICLAGQAPGLRVHKSGLPFDDASGDRLRGWMGIGRELFYDRSRLAIVPMGFCFPGYDKNKSDLPPRKECELNWHDQVFAAMPQIEMILIIGLYAQKYHLGSTRAANMTDTVRDWRQHFQRNHSPRMLPLPHPSWRNTSWLKKNPWFTDEVLPVLRDETTRLIGM